MISAPGLIKGSAGATLHLLAKTAPQRFFLSPAEFFLLAWLL